MAAAEAAAGGHGGQRVADAGGVGVVAQHGDPRLRGEQPFGVAGQAGAHRVLDAGGVVVPRAAGGHHHRRVHDAVRSAVGGDGADRLVDGLHATRVAVVVGAAVEQEWRRDQGADAATVGGHGGHRRGGRVVDEPVVGGVAVLVAVEQERRAGNAVADLGGAGRHGCGVGGVGAAVAVVVVGGDHGRDGELVDPGADAAHGRGRQRLAAVADALAEVGPVDRVGGRAHERLDDAEPAGLVGAAVDVLGAVLADAAAGRLLPRLHGVVDLVAAGAPGERAGADVGHRDAELDEHDVEPVAPLGGVRVGLVADVRAGHGDELVLVAQGVHRLAPDVEQLPGGGLDDVLDQDHLVAVDLGRAHDVPEGGAGAVQRGGGHVSGRLQQRQLRGVLAAAAAGRGQLGADRRGPQHVAVGQAAHVVVGDVGDDVVGVREVGGVGLDRLGPVVGGQLQLQARVLQPDRAAAVTAEDVGVGDAGRSAAGSPVAGDRRERGLDLGELLGGEVGCVQGAHRVVSRVPRVRSGLKGVPYQGTTPVG